jgi:hypothetical protein
MSSNDNNDPSAEPIFTQAQMDKVLRNRLNEQGKKHTTETQALRLELAVRDAGGDQFQMPAAQLANLMREGYFDGNRPTFDEQTQSFVIKDQGGNILKTDRGYVVTLGEWTEQLAAKTDFLVRKSGASVTPARTGNIEAKEDCRSNQEKIEFIRTHGFDAWADLPLKRKK